MRQGQDVRSRSTARSAPTSPRSPVAHRLRDAPGGVSNCSPTRSSNSGTARRSPILTSPPFSKKRHPTTPQKEVGIGEMNAAFMARMERILWLYAQPHDPRFPVICFDERPCFLIGNAVEPLAPSSGNVHKDHYAFEKNGFCSLVAAIEPLTGRRFA
jgi:hypothetical protein